MPKPLEKRMAEHIESSMTDAEREYMPTGQSLIEDILGWMDRTEIQIDPDGDAFYYVLQYELNE